MNWASLHVMFRREEKASPNFSPEHCQSSAWESPENLRMQDGLLQRVIKFIINTTERYAQKNTQAIQTEVNQELKGVDLHLPAKE